MVYLYETKYFIPSPDICGDLSRKMRLNLLNDIKTGMCLFRLPDKLEGVNSSLKKSYKAGYLFDVLSILDPNLKLSDKYEIINSRYHLWVTRRQFTNLLKTYNDRKVELY